jgi:hypothetical protein
VLCWRGRYVDGCGCLLHVKIVLTFTTSGAGQNFDCVGNDNVIIRMQINLLVSFLSLVKITELLHSLAFGK